MISFIKKYPKSTKFVLSLLIFGTLAVFGGGSWLSWICIPAFIADIYHFYISGGAGDQ